MTIDHVRALTRPLLRPPAALSELRTRLLLLGFWTVMGAMETAKELASARFQQIDRTVADAILVNFPWWFFWAFGTLLVVALAERWPPAGPGGQRWRAWLTHGVAAAAVSVTHLTLHGVLVFFAVARGRTAGAELGAQVEFWLQGYAVLDFFVYWMVLGAYYALLYHRRFVEGELREAEAHAVAMRLEAEAVAAKLRALQMELNPHFLFNALNAVSGLVEEGRSTEATTVIARIGDLLRTTLRTGREREISLRRELEFVGLYLDMERVRFGPRLRIDVDVDETLFAARVPPMILQPLVENAVRHGAAKVSTATSIQVRAGLEGSCLRLDVIDDGPGLPSSPRLRDGTGLGNVRERLATLYGSDARLALTAPPRGRGLQATIRIPYHATEPDVVRARSAGDAAFAAPADRGAPSASAAPSVPSAPSVPAASSVPTAPAASPVPGVPAARRVPGALAVLFLAVFGSATGAHPDPLGAQDTVLFAEDFEAGLVRWRFPLGSGHLLTPTEDGGTALSLETRDLPVYAIVDGSEEWGAVRVEGRVLFPDDEDNYLGFIYCFRDDGRRMDFGSMYIKGNDGYVQANPHFDTNVGRAVYPELRAPLTGGSAIEIGQWQRFALEVVEGRAHLYVGDAEEPVITVAFGAEPEGAFGFEPRNPGGAVWIDDIVVRRIDGFTYRGPPRPEVPYRPESRVTEWEALGPLARFAPEVEAGGGEPGDMAGAEGDGMVEEAGRVLRWLPFPTDARGAVATGRLTEFRGDRRTAYFRTRIEAARTGPAVLRFSTADPLAIWLNGTFIGFAPPRAAAWWDAGENEERRPVHARVDLREGTNTLLVRVVGGLYASGGFFLSIHPGA